MSVEVRCIISDNSKEWEETLRASSIESAETDVKLIIESFNASLRPHEKPRKFIRIVAEKSIEEKTNGDKLKDFYSLLGDLRREYNNAFGNRQLKHMFPLIQKAYATLVNTGKSNVLNKYIKGVFGYVGGVPDHLRYLEDVDIVSLFKTVQNEK